MTQLLMKDAKFVFSDECMQAFNILKDKLTTAPVIVAPNWNLDLELMCDAGDYAVGAVLGQQIDKKFRPIYYAKFTIEIKDKYGTKNLATDHLSRLENPELEKLNKEAIRDSFPDEHLMAIHVREAENDPWTAYKSLIGSTPFRIVYGKACHLLIKMEHKAYWTLKNVNLDLDAARKHRYLQLYKLAELRNEAYEHSRTYKERTKRWHDAKIMDKEFHEGEEVLVFNSRLKLFLGKLKTRWYGPYTISKVFPYGTVEVCEGTRALEQETRDLDVENKHKKNLKASYGVTTPQELRCMSEAKESGSTVNEYLTKIRDDNGPGIVKPLFKENIKFEFWGQCIEELKENAFYGKENEDPHEHISNISKIVNLFHSPGKIETIRNFKQEPNEPLHCSWERFTESLFSCPEHKLNEHEQLQIFYQGLDVETRRKVYFKGPIPIMTPTKGIEAIKELSEHSLLVHGGNIKAENEELQIVLKQINNFENNIVTHKYSSLKHDLEVWEDKRNK
ncbi:reverse transcriptase domain-containing protein [Tanacetum coccineum]